LAVLVAGGCTLGSQQTPPGALTKPTATPPISADPIAALRRPLRLSGDRLSGLTPAEAQHPLVSRPRRARSDAVDGLLGSEARQLP
jgi:hypothetical protein